MKRIPRKRQMFFRRRALKIAKHRARRRGYGHLYGLQVRLANAGIPRARRVPHKLDVRPVELKGRLDLRTDPVTTIGQLRELDRCARTRWKRSTRVHVLLDGLLHIDAPSLLYLCSRIDLLDSIPNVLVSGTYPQSERARKVLRDARFEDFLSGFRPSRRPRDRTLELHVGGSSEGEWEITAGTAARLQQFLARLNPDLTDQERGAIYLAAMEWIENVRNHAYLGGARGRRRSAWYLTGVYDEESKTATVAILDRGVGIRQSVLAKPRRLIERLFGVSTSEIIREATLGLRTQSGERHRGKGLSTLRKFVAEHEHRQLFVLSANGMVVWGNEPDCKQHEIPYFDGTIVCLEIGERDGS